MNESLRKDLLDRVAEGHRAFAEVERLMADDRNFAEEVASRSANGLPLVLLHWPDAPEVFRRMIAVDAENSRWLVDVVATVGWPDVSLVGAEGEAAAWELAMHADTEQEARNGWVQVIQDAADCGDVPPEHAQYLRMRVDAVARLLA
ncbi:MAG TPA: hypothetical protein VK988_19020 [Acidimicrobiales bacterium]|nr:hypothetical protein [Acidimicrobiales bacterium]